MSYTDDCMQSLTIALKNTDTLKYEIRDFNQNINTFKRLAVAIERHNELMEMQLGLKELTNETTSFGTTSLNIKRRKL